jgi:UDP-N-acetyl-D-glucosamine dehydrogenase
MRTNDNRTLAIIGQGYVGLPLAMAAVESGWIVIGIDNFGPKVDMLNKGKSPVEDITDTVLKAAISRGLYRATTDFSSAADASVITICVPTPLDENRQPDLSLLRSAASSMAPFVNNECLVVNESTSYPGTLREIISPIIESLKPLSSTKIYFASAPERVNPGDLAWSQRNTPRLVGGLNSESKIKAFEFYQSICDEVIAVDSPEIAEAAKLLENSFRLVNIALINEFAKQCSSAGIDVNSVIDAAASKPYGFMPFRPGVGVGGHCIPVDPLYLTWWAREKGGTAHMIETADSVNTLMPSYVAERALSLVDSLILNPKVLILGVAYKSGVGDVRETPVSELRRNLEQQGAHVEWHDPLVPTWENTKPVDFNWPCDVAILATMQEGLEINELLKRGVRILDCTNSYKNQEGVYSL